MRGVGTAWCCLLSGRNGVEEEASACTDEKRRDEHGVAKKTKTKKTRKKGKEKKREKE